MVAQTTTDYDTLHDLLTRRLSIRKLKPDPLPEGTVERLLDNARWAMSGANSQPWEYIVVTDPDTKQRLFEAYHDINNDFIFWMEQQRILELRHPSYIIEGDPQEALRQFRNYPGWNKAPALIAVIGDGRKQWGTVQGAHTFGRDQSHLTDGLANTCTLIHLSAAALGLGTQWVTIHIQEPFKRILGVPDVYMFYLIIPVGYPAVPPRPGVRRPLEELVHYERYHGDRYLSNREIVDYLRSLRQKTKSKYDTSRGRTESPSGNGQERGRA